jgi:hypothetical protein
VYGHLFDSDLDDLVGRLDAATFPEADAASPRPGEIVTFGADRKRSL